MQDELNLELAYWQHSPPVNMCNDCEAVYSSFKEFISSKNIETYQEMKAPAYQEMKAPVVASYT